jgi:hypothetical protein
MKLIVRLITEGFVWVRTYDDLQSAFQEPSEALVHSCMAQKETVSGMWIARDVRRNYARNQPVKLLAKAA